jgi:hypothetical protein
MELKTSMAMGIYRRDEFSRTPSHFPVLGERGLYFRFLASPGVGLNSTGENGESMQTRVRSAEFSCSPGLLNGICNPDRYWQPLSLYIRSHNVDLHTYPTRMAPKFTM